MDPKSLVFLYMSIDLHQVGVGLFVFFSILSLILVVSKPVAKEFEATALRWIRAFKRIRAEWRKPLAVAQPAEPRRLSNRTHSKRE